MDNVTMRAIQKSTSDFGCKSNTYKSAYQKNLYVLQHKTMIYIVRRYFDSRWREKKRHTLAAVPAISLENP